MVRATTVELTTNQSDTTGPDSQNKEVSRGSEFNIAAHGLRGIAAMMVFYGHLLGGTAKHIYDEDPSYLRMVDDFWHLGTSGVVLFFVISGFVILPSVTRYRPSQFAFRRFVRLYPLFLLLTLLFIALNAMTNAYPTLNDSKTIIAAFFFANIFIGTEQLTPNAWSLSFEVMFYALTCLTVYFCVHRPSRIGLVASVGLCLGFTLIFPIACFFLGGIGIRLLHDRRIEFPPWIARPLELIAAGCFLYYASRSWFAYVPEDFTNPTALKIIASSICYFFLAIPSTSLTTKCLRSGEALYVGTVSYSLYLVHPYIYYACRLTFDRLGWFTENQLISMLLFFGVTTPITFAVTHVVHRTIEMKPYEWVFRQRIYRDMSPADPATVAGGSSTAAG